MTHIDLTTRPLWHAAEEIAETMGDTEGYRPELVLGFAQKILDKTIAGKWTLTYTEPSGREARLTDSATEEQLLAALSCMATLEAVLPDLGIDFSLLDSVRDRLTSG